MLHFWHYLCNPWLLVQRNSRIYLGFKISIFGIVFHFVCVLWDSFFDGKTFLKCYTSGTICAILGCLCRGIVESTLASKFQFLVSFFTLFVFCGTHSLTAKLF